MQITRWSSFEKGFAPVANGFKKTRFWSEISPFAISSSRALSATIMSLYSVRSCFLEAPSGSVRAMLPIKAMSERISCPCGRSESSCSRTESTFSRLPISVRPREEPSAL